MFGVLRKGLKMVVEKTVVTINAILTDRQTRANYGIMLIGLGFGMVASAYIQIKK